MLTILATTTDVYVGGTFRNYRDLVNSTNGLARLDATSGALIATFGAAGESTNGFNSAVVSLALNGTSLYVGGSFTQYKSVANSARYVAKLNTTTGAIDATFSPPGAAANGFDNVVNVIALVGSSLYVGGAFDNYRGVVNSSRRIAKLDASTGALDTIFSPPANNGFEGNIYGIFPLGSSILVSGAPLGGYRGPEDLTTGIAKIDATSGVLDPTFLTPTGHDRTGFPYPTGPRSALLVGDKLWIGGDFTHLGGKSANGIARIKDADGTLDRTFSPPASNGFDYAVTALVATSDALYVGGRFSAYRGVSGSASHLAKLNLTTGAIDVAFSPPGEAANGFNDTVEALLAADGALYVGGGFTAYRGVADSANALAKLDIATGVIDTNFSPAGETANGFDSDVESLAKSGSSLFVGGDFEDYRGGMKNANGIAKLDATTGVLDTTFSPPADNGFDGDVSAIAIIGNGVFVGGNLTSYRGTSQLGYIAKLDATTGALDATFSAPGPNSGFDDEVKDLAVSGGALYAAGYFLSYRGVAGSANYLAKLDPTTGALDSVFTPSGATTGNSSLEMVVPFQSSLMLGGYFSNCEGDRCYRNANRVNRNTRMGE